MLTFRVLGPLAAHLDGEPVALGRPRQRSVLARLLAAGGRAVPVDRLIDDLYADEVPPKALAAVQSYVSNLRLRLDGLAAPEVAELIAVTCGRPAAPETVAEIAERTGGNPFFVRETARLLDAEGATTVPAGVRDVLRRRVARLPAQAQTILRHGAVIGRESDVDVLTAVSGADEESVLTAIESGLVTGLLTEPEAGRLRFAHVLIRDTLYDDLSRIRRARLHLRVARAIEERDPGDVAALAHHYTASAADPAKAVRYARLAAEQAERRFAHHEAAALWRQALDAFDGDPRERLELTLSLVSALANTGRLVEARTHRERAIREALPLGDPDLLARVIVSFDVPTFWSNREYGTLDSDLIDAVEGALAERRPRAPPRRAVRHAAGPGRDRLLRRPAGRAGGRLRAGRVALARRRRAVGPPGHVAARGGAADAGPVRHAPDARRPDADAARPGALRHRGSVAGAVPRAVRAGPVSRRPNGAGPPDRRRGPGPTTSGTC